jgi:hypothetical protein
MPTLYQVLLMLHFLGLALGFASSFGNAVMSVLISRAEPADRAVLGRVPPAISKLGATGLALLWITGLALVYVKYGGFAILPWQFSVKLVAVVVLTVAVAYAHRLQALIRKGDREAMTRIQAVGKVAMMFALVALVFAVLAFA